MVSEFDAGSGRSADSGEPDRDGKRVAQLLSALADDPNAPPSSVTASSVIAVAHAAARAELGTADDEPVTREEPAGPMTSAPTADVVEFRPRRRRFALAGLVAAVVLDAIVARYMENDEPIESIIAAGFERADVERVTRLIKINEYTRRQAPPGVKLSTRNFGRDRRSPITNAFRTGGDG